MIVPELPERSAAGLPPEPALALGNPGPLFEQWVGIELWKRLGYLGEGRLSYFRTKTGVEVDYILEHRGKLIPIEVKWTDRPDMSDARHLRSFLDGCPLLVAIIARRLSASRPLSHIYLCA